MQISSLLDILDGKLLNSPSISFIYSIKSNAKKVKEGDLFIAKDLSDIELAIKNGAFAILLETNSIITDNEIAWIKVENINQSIIKLIRFKLALKNLEAYFCNKVIYDLLKIYTTNFSEKLRLIPNKLENMFKFIDEIEDNDIIIFHNQTILNDIYPNSKILTINSSSYKIENLIEHSLFETSFSNNGIYFNRLKIPSLYLYDFLQVFKFLNQNLDFNKLKQFHNLKPIFLDRNLNLIEFGKSDKFIISQDDKDLYKDEILYLKEKYKYAKTIFLTLKYIDELKKEEQIIIKNIEELKPTLIESKFNCAYLIGFNLKEIYKYLLKSESSTSLF